MIDPRRPAIPVLLVLALGATLACQPAEKPAAEEPAAEAPAADAPATAGGGEPVFEDGFESGDATQWKEGEEPAEEGAEEEAEEKAEDNGEEGAEEGATAGGEGG